MKLLAAMIADAATVQGGKLYVHGGGWDTIYARKMPVRHPSLTVVFLLEVEHPQTMTEIPLVIEMLNEQGERLPPRFETRLNLSRAPGSRPGGTVRVPNAVTFELIELVQLGGYRFRITAAGKVLGEVPFQVLSPPSRVQD